MEVVFQSDGKFRFLIYDFLSLLKLWTNLDLALGGGDILIFQYKYNEINIVKCSLSINGE